MLKHSLWLDFAKDDLKAAKILLPEKLLSISSYHIQQSVEKALKGYLAYQKIPVIKTHNLLLLVESCADSYQEFNIFAETAEELNSYLTDGRYPGNMVQPPESPEIIAAIDYAEQILDFVQKRTKK
jgi:HEPN domain-containing protein